MSKTVYLDEDFICHEAPGEGLREIVTEDYLDGTDDVSNIRFVPAGEMWTRSDGAEFSGLMITQVALE